MEFVGQRNQISDAKKSKQEILDELWETVEVRDYLAERLAVCEKDKWVMEEKLKEEIAECRREMSEQLHKQRVDIEKKE